MISRFDLAPTGAMRYIGELLDHAMHLVLISPPQGQCAIVGTDFCMSRYSFDLAPTGAMRYKTGSPGNGGVTVLISPPQGQCAIEEVAKMKAEAAF